MITDSGKPKKNRKNPNDPLDFLKVLHGQW